MTTCLARDVSDDVAMDDLTIAATMPRVMRYSELDVPRLVHLAQLTRDVVARGVPGDVVECGVAAGGSAAVLAWSILYTDRHCWCYDSFRGLPSPTDEDGPDATKYAGANRCSPDRLREALSMTEMPLSRCHIQEGWFAETFTQSGPETIAVLHIDADWYSSVSLCLHTWYERVSRGGVIVLDDFGYWPGCRQAFYEFCSTHMLTPVLQRYGDSAWWVKGATR